MIPSAERSCLATTSLRDFWDASLPVVVLGDFCVDLCQNGEMEAGAVREIEGVALGKDAWEKAVSYCDSVYERLLPVVSSWMNKVHGVQYGERYWRIFIGPFLMWYTQILYEKYRRISLAYEQFSNLTTIGMEQKSYVTPDNTLHFWNLASESDAWNLQISTQIIGGLGRGGVIHKPFEWDGGVERTKVYGDRGRLTLGENRRRRAAEAVAALNSKAKIVFGLSTMSLFSRFRLALISRLRMWPYLNMQWTTPAGLSYAAATRSSLADLSGFDSFSNLLLATLTVNMPSAFIEAYSDLREKASQMKSLIPRIIVSDEGWYFDELFKVWAAEKSEAGTRLVAVQHGGAYGSAYFSSSEMHEKKISDYYFSWGWSDSTKIIPMPSQRMSGMPRVRKRSKKLILFAGTSFPRFTLPAAMTMSEYLDYQVRFVRSLDKALLSCLVMRVYYSDYGWGTESFLRRKIPELKIERAGSSPPLPRRLGECKIFVTDNNGTSLLQALALNVPTILFWDPNLEILRESSLPPYDALREVGILHETPESAASMLRRVYDSPEDWWNSVDVQNARDGFCNVFARTDAKWLSRWADTLKALLVRGDPEKC